MMTLRRSWIPASPFQNAVHRHERAVRAPAQFAGAVRSLLRVLDEVARRHAVADDAVHRRLHVLEVVGEIDRRPGRTVGNESHEVAVVHENVGRLLDEVADPGGDLRLQMHRIDEEDDDPSRDLALDALLGEDDALVHRRRWDELVEDPAAVHQDHRCHLLGHAVFQYPKVGRRQIGNEGAVGVADDDVGADQGDAGPEGGRGLPRYRSLGSLGRRRGCDCRRQGEAAEASDGSCVHRRNRWKMAHGDIQPPFRATGTC